MGRQERTRAAQRSVSASLRPAKFEMWSRSVKGLFGYEGTEGKLAFRQHALHRLHTETVPSSDAAFWRQFQTLFTSASEVASLMPADVLRLAIAHKPENVACLIQTLATRIFKLLSDPSFPAASTSSSWLPSTSVDDRCTELLNCMRVLSRLWPLLFEVSSPPASLEEQQDEPDWLRKLLWSRADLDAAAQDEAQFIIEDEDSLDTSMQSSLTAASSQTEREQSPSLGQRLSAPFPNVWRKLIPSRLQAAVDLLFLVDFTLPPDPSGSKRKRRVQYTIWHVRAIRSCRHLTPRRRQPGIGSSSSLLNTTKAHLSHRTEVLRFLISLVSSTMYITPNLFLAHLVTMRERKPALSLLCSLINTALVKTESSSLIISPTEALNRLQVVTTGQREEDEQASALPHLCISLLDILHVSHEPSPAGSDPPMSPTVGIYSPVHERFDTSFSMSSAVAKPENIFRHYSAKLHQQADYKFLLDGVLGLLSAANAGTTSLLSSMPAGIPGFAGLVSNKSADVTEIVVFLWKMTECNKVCRLALFCETVLTQSRAF
jgi:hypothetical protein